MFYAPVLFQTIGFGNDAALMSAVVTGLVNVGATVVSIYGVDKWGRRFLFLEGGLQMLISQVFFISKINSVIVFRFSRFNISKWLRGLLRQTPKTL